MVNFSNADSYEKLKDLIAAEEFKMCVPSEFETFLDEYKVQELHDAAVLADDYMPLLTMVHL
jgi:hypothetical protein